jgi:vacuolar-type H+-ATPase subunit F/Vma7
MVTAAVIGDPLDVEGYALAGASVYPARTPDETVAAFQALPHDTGLLLMSATAEKWLAGRLAQRPGLLTAVLGP